MCISLITYVDQALLPQRSNILHHMLWLIYGGKNYSELMVKVLAGVGTARRPKSSDVGTGGGHW